MAKPPSGGAGRAGERVDGRWGWRSGGVLGGGNFAWQYGVGGWLGGGWLLCGGGGGGNDPDELLVVVVPHRWNGRKRDRGAREELGRRIKGTPAYRNLGKLGQKQPAGIDITIDKDKGKRVRVDLAGKRTRSRTGGAVTGNGVVWHSNWER